MRWNIARGLLLGGVLLGMLEVAPAGVQSLDRSNPPNILLITIDTLRADRVGAYGYKTAVTPTLDALAASGARFTDAVAHVPLTYPSHVSVLTGRYASAFGIRVNGPPVLSDDVTTIAERLKVVGYRTAAFVGSTLLDSAYGLDQGFDSYDDDLAPPVAVDAGQVSTSELQRPAADVIAAASRWITAQQVPWFAWVHLYDPHLPYAPPAEYARKLPGRPYDGEVSYADAMLGRLLNDIDRARTVVAVTSDHGESLGEHGESDHGYYIYDSTLKVPLIISGPGIGRRTILEQVRLIDLMPTLLTLAGERASASPSGAIDGVSLVALLNGESRRDPPVSLAESWYPRLHFGWSELRGVRVGEFMYIAAPKPELYDLRVDPGQQTNVIDRKSPVAARLAGELRTTTPRPNQTPTPAPDAETVRRLQALGYVGSFAPVTAGAGDDPKDRVADYTRYRALLNRALGELDRGRAASAVPLLRQLIKLNVRAFEAHLYLGNAYAATGKSDAALGEYEAALQLNPELTVPRIEMAKVLHERGETARAISEIQMVLAKEPRSFYAWYTVGVIHRKAGRHLDAFKAFSEAAKLNASDARAAGNLADAALRTGQTVVAREQFERMIALSYQVAPAHYNLGLLAQRTGDRAAAERHFKAALAADPGFKPARDAMLKFK